MTADTPSTGDRFERAAALFDEAADLPEDERDAFLAARCGDDAELLAEVRALLDADAAAERAEGARDGFLEAGAARILGDTGTRSFDPVPGTRVGAFTLEAAVGAGGSGRVFRARQDRPRRHVALKFLRARVLSEAAVEAFEAEAEILAGLRHPGVAHVYAAGVHRAGELQVPYYALEYVEGARSLTEFAAEEGLDRAARLTLLAQVADAVHHGHQSGVLHLDLKPANVLVGSDGRAKIIDFGIARRTGGDDAAAGRLAGTTAYMSPEQAAAGGGRVDARSDVYALGAILFELLGGRPLLDVGNASIDDVLARVRDEERPRLDTVDASLRGELAAITARALARDPEARYASASALADDIRRHLRREPIAALPQTPGYVLAKLAQRRPWLAAAAALLVVVLGVATAVSTDLAISRTEATRRAERQAYLAGIAAAQASIESADVDGARARLASLDPGLRGWEWRHLWSRLDDSTRSLSWKGPRTQRASLSPDGTLLAVYGTSTSREPEIQILEVATGEIVQSIEGVFAHALAFSPDNRALVASRESELLIWDLPAPGGGVATPAVMEPHDERINDLAWHATRPWVVTACKDGTLALCDIAERTVLRRLEGHGDRVVGVRFSPDGARIASAGRAGDVRLWNTTDGTCTSVLRGHRGSVEAVAWSADGSRIASVSRDRSVRVWDAADGRAVWARHDHDAAVRDVTFVPGAGLVASAGWDRTVRYWDVATGDPVATMRGHGARVMSVAAPPDGGSVVSLAQNGTIKVWPVRAVGAGSLAGQVGRIAGAGVAPDGTTLVTCSRMGTVWRWDLATGTGRPMYDYGSNTPNWAVLFPGEGGDVVQVARPSSVFRFETIAPGETVVRQKLPAGMRRPAKQTWRGRLAVASGFREVVIYDLETAREREIVGTSEAFLQSVAVSSFAGRIVTVNEAHGVEFWDPAARRLTASGAGRASPAVCSFARPGADQVAIGYEDGHVEIWNARTGEREGSFLTHAAGVLSLAYSPGGDRLAVGGSGGVLRLYDAVSFEQVIALERGEVNIWSVAWSPDGRRLVAGHGAWGSPATISVWDAPETIEESR